MENSMKPRVKASVSYSAQRVEAGIDGVGIRDAPRARSTEVERIYSIRLNSSSPP